MAFGSGQFSEVPGLLPLCTDIHAGVQCGLPKTGLLRSNILAKESGAHWGHSDAIPVNTLPPPPPAQLLPTVTISQVIPTILPRPTSHYIGSECLLFLLGVDP
jgi:hypothetical protein